MEELRVACGERAGLMGMETEWTSVKNDQRR